MLSLLKQKKQEKGRGKMKIYNISPIIRPKTVNIQKT